MVSPIPNRHVLVVDDIDDVRTSVRMLLELEGHTVREARDGESALKALLTGEFDIALIDLGLPGMDGHELARRIRHTDIGARISLVAVSGQGTDKHYDEAIDAGFDEFMPKPPDMGVLGSWVNELPRRHAQNK